LFDCTKQVAVDFPILGTCLKHLRSVNADIIIEPLFDKLALMERDDLNPLKPIGSLIFYKLRFWKAILAIFSNFELFMD
jgi:hypothetical protein